MLCAPRASRVPAAWRASLPACALTGVRVLSVFSCAVVVACQVFGMASDLGFDAAELLALPTFVASVAFLLVGVCLSLFSCGSERLCPTARAAMVADHEAAVQEARTAPLLFDENRHQLSPTAKRLLV